MHLRRSILMLNMMCNLLPDIGEYLFTLSKYLVSSLRESEMSDMKVRVCRCTIAQCMNALKNMRAVRCLSTPARSDRELLVHHQAFGLPTVQRT